MNHVTWTEPDELDCRLHGPYNVSTSEHRSPLEAIVTEIQKSDKDLESFMQARQSGNTLPKSHSQQMDSEKAQCLVRLHPEVIGQDIVLDNKKVVLCR